MRTLSLLLALVVFVSCNGNSAGAVAAAEALALIGQAGGELTLGEATVTVPPGALTGPHELRLRELDAAARAQLPVVTQQAWDLTGRPEGDAGPHRPLTFAAPVTIHVRVDRHRDELLFFLHAPPPGMLAGVNIPWSHQTTEISADAAGTEFNVATPGSWGTALLGGLKVDAGENHVELTFTQGDDAQGEWTVSRDEVRLSYDTPRLVAPKIPPGSHLATLSPAFREALVQVEFNCETPGEHPGIVPVGLFVPDRHPDSLSLVINVKLDCPDPPEDSTDRDGDYFLDVGIGEGEMANYHDDLGIVIGARDGWGSIDPFSGKIKANAIQPSSFPMYGAVPIEGPGDELTILGYGLETGTLRKYNPGTGLAPLTVLFAGRYTDGARWADDPETAVLTDFGSNAITIRSTRNPSGLPGRVLANFDGIDGNVVSAAGRENDVLVVTTGTPGASPGQIVVVEDITVGENEPLVVGMAEDDTRQVELLADCAAATNFGAGSVTWLWWPSDEPDKVEVIAHIPTGPGCLAVALTSLTGGLLGAVTTNYEGHSYSLIVYDPATRQFAVQTHDLPGGARYPVGVTFVKDSDETRIAVVVDGGDRVYSAAVSFEFD